MQSCCSPIAFASAAAPRAIASIRSTAAAERARLASAFSCCSPLASASAAALDCVRFNCFPIASASAAAPRLRPLQLCSPMASASSAAPRLRSLQLLLPDCVRFGCCSPPAVLEDSGPAMSTILEYSSRFKYEGRASL